MKNILRISMFVLFVVCFAASALAHSKQYKVGDMGPAGGYIFFVNPNAAEDGWTYLEIAPQETEWSDVVWMTLHDNDKEIIGAVEQDFGKGKENTDILVAWFDKNGFSDTPAQLCKSLDYGGFKDWYLPALNELDIASYALHYSMKLGDFQDGSTYWSSSEGDEFSAFTVLFAEEGGPSTNNRFTSKLNVRAVRRF